MRFVEETDGKSFVQVNDGTKKDDWSICYKWYTSS